MKKTLMMMAIAACAASAQAATTYYGLGYQLATGPKDVGQGDITAAALKYYSVYSLSAAQLSAAMTASGTEITLKKESAANAEYNAKQVTKWINENFVANSASVQVNKWWIKTDGLGKAIANSSQSGSPYMLARLAVEEEEKASAPTRVDNKWVVTFYNDGKSLYYRVADTIEGGTGYQTVTPNDLDMAKGQFVVRGGATASDTGWGDWTKANVIPEPTSGLLMLLGLAGLALKRKRA